MRWIMFVILPLGLAAAFWFGSSVWPDLASKELMRSIAGLFAVTWGGCAFALPKLSDLTAIDGLVKHEREQLQINIDRARNRIWRIGGLSLACAITLVFLSVITTPQNSHYVAAFAGFATGIGLGFIWTFKRWHDEIHAFIATVHQHRLDAKAESEVLKKFAGPS
jgi:hypothetical protein